MQDQCKFKYQDPRIVKLIDNKDFIWSIKKLFFFRIKLILENLVNLYPKESRTLSENTQPNAILIPFPIKSFEEL